MQNYNVLSIQGHILYQAYEKLIDWEIRKERIIKTKNNFYSLCKKYKIDIQK